MQRLLDGYTATSNKRAFAWVKQQSSAVTWLESARWVVDGNRWTSSGVSAGIDMTLALVAHLLGRPREMSLAGSNIPGWKIHVSIRFHKRQTIALARS